MLTLSREDKLNLVIGKGAWHTNDCNGQYSSVTMADGPHGLRIPLKDSTNQNNSSLVSTCYPTASAMASTWDINALSKMALSYATEAQKAGVTIILGPGINIKRSPLCGRNFEYYSEDPFLAGTLAASFINEMQSHGIGVSLKHFAGNSQETHRQTQNSQIDERALREIYLSAFETAIKHSKPLTIMASYNRLNGTYTCENKYLLTDILRREWGFQGTVISDWGAAIDLPKCIHAGMDLEMPDSLGIHKYKLEEALKSESSIIEQDLDRAAENVTKLIEYKMNHEIGIPQLQHESPHFNSHELAIELATEAAVLLKNDGILPLNSGTDILVVGDLATHMRFQGGGSSHITTIAVDDAVTSLEKAGYHVLYTKGYDNEEKNADLIPEAVSFAKRQIPVIFFGGLTDKAEGEGYDRTTLSPPDNQILLFQEIYKYNKNIIYISFSGAPYDLSFADNSRAILHMYLAGEGVGPAIAKLLSGKSCPSGKLPETFPLKLTDVPCYETFGKDSDDVEYRESIFVGYRYYDTYCIPVQYPFGYGLSYTSFSYSNMSVQSEYDKGPLSVSFTLSNTGSCFGGEITQIYVENPVCNYLRARKELRGFTKIFLKPGESKEVTIILNERSFSLYDIEAKDFIVPSGQYIIHIAASLNDTRLSASINVHGVEYQKDDRRIFSEYFDKPKDGFHISEKQFELLYGKELSHFDLMQPGEYSVCNSLRQLSRHSIFAKIMLVVSKHIAYGMYPGKSKYDPEVMMTIQGIKDGSVDSIICQSEGLVPYKIAEAIVLFANHHPLKALIKMIKKDMYRKENKQGGKSEK